MLSAISYSLIKDNSAPNAIFGLQVAVENMMKGFLRYTRQENFSFLFHSQHEVDEVQDYIRELGLDPNRLLPYDGRFPEENLLRFGTVFRTDPSPKHLLWQRALLKDHSFAFCGIAHAMGGIESGEVLEQYCLAPTAEGDAVISPSQAIKGVLRSFWDCYGDYLEQRFGVKYRCPVRLPVIPLGVDLERFSRICTAEKRAEQRAVLGIAADETVILWVGRLSYAIKAHPLPMLRAVEAAAKQVKGKVRFVMAGYFYPESSEQEFKDLAADFCQTAMVEFIGSKDPRFPDGLWAAGDIFLSLIDNMQESFGLTPIEAIAANLPRVITDWDGYRDSVQNGVDGFLVRTIQPPSGQGGELASLVLAGREMYGGYLGKTGLTVAIDFMQAADILVKLIESPELRQRIAAAARHRIPKYDWKNIIPAYEDLWEELAVERKAKCVNQTAVKWKSVPPQVPDPYTMYASFPTRALRDDDRFRVIAKSDEIKLLWKHPMNVLAFDVLNAPDQVTAMLNWLSKQNGTNIIEIRQQFPTYEEARLWRTLCWLLKLGIIGLV